MNGWMDWLIDRLVGCLPSARTDALPTRQGIIRMNAEIDDWLID